MSLFEEQLRGNLSLWPPQSQAPAAEGCPWRDNLQLAYPPERNQVRIPPYLFGCCFSQGSAGLFFDPKKKREKKN